MKIYRNPLDMFGLTFKQYKAQTKKVQNIQWRWFIRHVKRRGFIGLLNAFNKEKPSV